MKSKVTLNLKFHKLQRQIFDVVANTDKIIIPIAIGRQWGKSELCKGLSIYYSLFKGYRVMWVSVSNRSAKFHWRDIIDHVEKIPGVKISLSDRDIEFPSGGVLSVRSSVTSASLRGEPLDTIICDEAAHYIDGGETFWEALYPSIIASKGKCVLPSTPQGRNWFYNLYREGSGDDDEIVSFRYPSITSPIVDPKRVYLAKRFMSAIKWRQEFEAEFIGSNLSVFNNFNRVHEIEFLHKPINGREYLAGIDIGMGDNNTCVAILDSESREQVCGYKLDSIESVEIVNDIVGILDRWKPIKSVLETNGVGKPIIGMLKNVLNSSTNLDNLSDVYRFTFSREGKDHLLIGRHVTNRTKTDMVETLVAEVENGTLGILSTDTEYGKLQRDEMESYESKLSTSENFRVYSARLGKTDDTISALYLGCSLLPKLKVTMNNQEFHNPFKVDYASYR